MGKKTNKKDELDLINERMAEDLQKRMNDLFDKIFEKANEYVKNANPEELAKKLTLEGAHKGAKAFCGIMCESCTIAKSAEK